MGMAARLAPHPTMRALSQGAPMATPRGTPTRASRKGSSDRKAVTCSGDQAGSALQRGGEEGDRKVGVRREALAQAGRPNRHAVYT